MTLPSMTCSTASYVVGCGPTCRPRGLAATDSVFSAPLGSTCCRTVQVSRCSPLLARFRLTNVLQASGTPQEVCSKHQS